MEHCTRYPMWFTMVPHARRDALIPARKDPTRMRFSLNIASTILLMTVSATAIGAVPEDSLRAAAAGRLSMVADAELAINPVTSAVRHARFQPGVVVSDGTTISEKAELFLLRYGQAFGVDAPGIELKQIRERTDGLGHTHLVFDQVHRGIPVFGARMGLHFDSSGELISANAFCTKPSRA